MVDVMEWVDDALDAYEDAKQAVVDTVEKWRDDMYQSARDEISGPDSLRQKQVDCAVKGGPDCPGGPG